MFPVRNINQFTCLFRLISYNFSLCCDIMQLQLENSQFLREQAPMPITRRRRANPPDQPEDNNHSSDQPENIQETLATEQDPIAPLDGEHADVPLNELAGNTHASPTSSQPQHQAGSNGDRNDRKD